MWVEGPTKAWFVKQLHVFSLLDSHDSFESEQKHMKTIVYLHCIFLSSLSSAWCSVSMTELRQCLSGTADAGLFRSLWCGELPSFLRERCHWCSWRLHGASQPSRQGRNEGRFGGQIIQNNLPKSTWWVNDWMVCYAYIILNVFRYLDFSTIQIIHIDKHLQAYQRLVQKLTP